VLRDLGRALHGRAHGTRVAAAAIEHGADLIVETQVHFAASGARATRRSGVPLVLDDCSPPDEERTLCAGLPRLARALFQRQLAAASRAAVPSVELARLLEREGAQRDRVRIVPNGVDREAYARCTEDRAATRAALGAGSRCAVVFVGSFQPWHRIDLLVRALAGADDPSTFRVLLVGEGPGLEPALRLADAHGVAIHVKAVGALPSRDIPALLAACDIGVLPGTNEYGQPMKLLEYAAAGLPSVAPDLPPVRACVTPGRTGLLFSPGDPAALAAALLALRDRAGFRREMGRAAREHVLRAGTWADRAHALLGGAAPAPDATP
jgi:glycosyltransferase involved in cell wall biosynthesis